MNVQDIDVWSSEHRTETLTSRDSNNAVVDLTGGTLSWRAGSRESDYAMITKTPSIVSAAAGTYSVVLTPSDTQYLDGDYRHQTFFTASGGATSVVNTGRLRVRGDLRAA